ncbi:MAG: LysM peptidoglycan-binding domain-containing protein [Terriglobales bacterium]
MRTSGPKVAITLCVVLSAGVSLAQSLGDVARQDRERRSQLPQHARVISNDDLKQEHILDAAHHQTSSAAEDIATQDIATPTAVSALRSATSVGANVPLWGVAEQPGFSLGAYARALRQERSQREQQNAAVQQPVSEVEKSFSASIRSNNEAASSVTTNSQSEKRNSAELSARVIRNNAADVMSSDRIVTHDPALEIDPGPPLVRAARGDSLWRLARVHLGDGRLWPMLWESNPEIRNPGRLMIGQLLRIPARQLNFAKLQGKKLAASRRELVRRAGVIQVALAQRVNARTSTSSLAGLAGYGYLPTRSSTWAAAGLATLVKPSEYPTR